MPASYESALCDDSFERSEGVLGQEWDTLVMIAFYEQGVWCLEWAEG